MPIGPSAIRFVQNTLKREQLYAGAIDGALTPALEQALRAFPELKSTWPLERKVTGYIQLLASQEKIAVGSVDGLWGPKTQSAYDELEHRLLDSSPRGPRGEEERALGERNTWPSQATDAELIAFYGAVGTNQRKITLPYPHRLAWAPGKNVGSFDCNKRVHDSLLRVLNRVLDIYGIGEIQRLRLDLWGGCLNVRQMRGGTRYSMHSWGVALDYDPENNQLKWGADRAGFARPEYERWWRCWEDEGWVSLGRARNYDWMHVQAARP